MEGGAPDTRQSASPRGSFPLRGLLVALLSGLCIACAPNDKEIHMQHLRLVSLDIADPEGYARYRLAMEPLLETAGGRLLLDVEGRATIHPGGFVANRALLIAFDSAAAAQAFFASSDYVGVRARLFEPAVRNAHAVALP